MVTLLSAIVTLQAKVPDLLLQQASTVYAGRADSLYQVFHDQFFNTATGTFWGTPKDVSNNSGNLYWQQAHAIDVFVYAYERYRDTSPLTATYLRNCMDRWYSHHANNWYHKSDDPTGFYNEFTDDMCWICLTLIHMTEATGDEKFINTARTVFDEYIWPRQITDNLGTGLYWKLGDDNRNDCTNAPGCLVAAKLFEHTGDSTELKRALTLYEYTFDNFYEGNGKLSEPPLSYTVGTFAEAARHLYHITGDDDYRLICQRCINYVFTSTRCGSGNILRDEGHNNDQSIFKAVFIPYAVNFVLDDDMPTAHRYLFMRYLHKNADTLWSVLDKTAYDSRTMYCPYGWNTPFDTTSTASMGAMASGTSLMVNVARMNHVLLKDAATPIDLPTVSNRQSDAPQADDTWYNLSGQRVGHAARHGIYITHGKKIIR